MFTKTAHILATGVERVSRLVNWIGAVVLAAMMFLIAADVILRYVFNSPIPGALEVSEFLLIMVLFFGVAYTAVKKGHVPVDLVTSRLPPRAAAILSSGVSFMGILLFALLAWRVVIYAFVIKQTAAVSFILRVPIYPFILIIAFGSALLCVVLFSDLMDSMSRALQKSRWQVWVGLLLAIVLSLLLITIPAWGPLLNWHANALIVGLVGLAVLVLILFTGLPVGFVMILVGFLGVSYLRGTDAGYNILGVQTYRSLSFDFCVIPLFILMGVLAFYSQLSADLYKAIYKWIGHLPGGMAIATIAGCAGFASVCGENVAVTSTMGKVALPEMKRYRYDPALATGCIASGGTLGVLIPPSLSFMLYGLLTEQSIGKLFLAGILPGILFSLLMMITIYIMTKRDPLLGPPGPKTTIKDKLVAIKGIWGIVALFALVMGGIYFGIFTPTEGAGIGAFGALLFSVVTGRFTRRNFVSALLETTLITAMALIMLTGGTIFGTFMSVSTVPMWLANWAVNLPVSPLVILIIILFVYLILGCLMSAIAMLLLTVPIFYPVFVALGFDPIWAGVIVTFMWTAANVTPPVGITVFVMKGVAPEIPMYTIFRGVAPFFVDMMATVGILIAFPQIATFLPNLLM